MPANKNAITRYYILDQLLANRYHHYSVKDLLELLNEKLEELGQAPVCERTLDYDIKYLEIEGPFLAEIEHYQIDVPSQKDSYKTVKKNCLRYVDPDFSIFKKELTHEERYLLKEAISLLGQFNGLPNLEGLERLRESLQVNQQQNIISLSKNPLEYSNRIGELFTAISQKQVVKLQYHTFVNPQEPKTIEVYPYLLKEYNRRWFLVCAAVTDNRMLTFALDRIDQIVALPDRTYRPCAKDLEERYEDIVGVTLYEDRPLQKIVFWVSDSEKDYVNTKPIHESQTPIRGERLTSLKTEFPMLEQGAFYQIECIENYELIRELSQYGANLIVLSPNNIRDSVFERVKEMYKRYSDVRK